MQKGLFRKGLVFGIIFLFVGASVLPSTFGTTKEKMFITKIGNRGYIQDLIDNASDGDTIYIPSGIYYENIIINKSISLVGEDKNITIIDGGGNYPPVVYISADWVNISGFTIQNGTNGPTPGIVIGYSCYNNITGNILRNNDFGIELGNSSSNIIKGNTCSNNLCGIVLIEKTNNNTITDNNISNNYGGIEFNGHFGSCNDNIIKGNNISSNYECGIYSYYSNENNITGNNISNNFNGIKVYESNSNIITNNNIIGNGDHSCWTYSGGILLNRSYGNTIIDNNISYNAFYGIALASSNYNIITGNEIKQNGCIIPPSGDGIYLDKSDNNTLIDNIISNNFYGIRLSSSSSTITDNSFFNDGLLVHDSYNNNVENNMVNEKPLVYFEDVFDEIITDAGQVILVNCNNITLENLDLSNASVGIELWRTHNSSIKNNNCLNNMYGIFICESNSNIIKNNTLGLFTLNGIYLGSSNGNNIIGNNISNNRYGIRLSESSSNIITYNNISNNGDGIYVYESSGNNIIHHNNFIDNTDNAYDEANNIWDDGKKGNYWSDYEERYPDAKKKPFKGIWDTPYEIPGGDNQDNYPLIKPFNKPRTRTITRNMEIFNNLLHWFLERFPFLEILFNNLRRFLG